MFGTGLTGYILKPQDDAELIARCIARAMHGPDAAHHWRLYQPAANAILRDFHIRRGGQQSGGGSLFG